jgi:DNA-binding NarL/FixJ family response regulator
MTETPSFSPKTRVVIVDDHPMLRERIAQLINKEPDMTVCGESDNIQAALECIADTQPDIAVVDITLKGSSGLELIKNLKALGLNTPVLVLSMHDESLYADRALRSGARGYITKHQGSEAVMAAIRCVLGGKVYLSEDHTAKILNRLTEQGPQAAAPSMDLLTDRELEVFQMIGQGHTSREIAETLHLGTKTVDTYRERIKQKLDLKNAAVLYHRATEWVRNQG